MRRRFCKFGQAAALSLNALAWSALASAEPPPWPAAPPPQAPPAPLPSAMVRISPPDPHITLERRVGSLDLSPVPRSMYADLSPRWTSVNDVNGGNLPDYVGPVALLHAHGWL